MRVPKGFRAAGISCGIKMNDKEDLALIESEEPCVAAGFFTKNRFAAPPVELCRKHLEKGAIRGVVVNSGCANACTGKRGLEDAEIMAAVASKTLHCSPGEILVASTGVIGAFLPMEKIKDGISKAAMKLTIGSSGWRDAARAIMTTDKLPKYTLVDLEIAGHTISFLGICKGSGMIHPDMATMLAFIVTDAAITPSAMKKAGRHAVDRSFNCVTVDGDTSTNDTVVFLANGMAGNHPFGSRSKDYRIFETVLTEVCQVLARMIASDGEGATKLIEVAVTGAASEKDAKKVANAVAGSNLVKTAIFGRDANWGRIVCAIGNSGAGFNPNDISVHIGPELIFEGGAPALKSERTLKKIFERKEIPIKIDLKSGDKTAVLWTCDLTYDYIKINAEYRT